MKYVSILERERGFFFIGEDIVLGVLGEGYLRGFVGIS